MILYGQGTWHALPPRGGLSRKRLAAMLGAMKLFVLARCGVFIVFLLWAGHGGAQTWIQWRADQGGNGHYFALTPCATNWNAAESLAVSWGGTLAIVRSQSEQDFINATFLTGPLEHRPVWIGLIRKTTNPTMIKLRRAAADLGLLNAGKVDDFRWVTGERVSYNNWHPGQPDNFPPGESYATINWHYSDNRGTKGDWNDAPLNGTTGFGGMTEGPYFGLVERATDPALPIPFHPSTLLWALIALTLVAAFLILTTILRRQKKLAYGKAGPQVTGS